MELAGTPRHSGVCWLGCVVLLAGSLHYRAAEGTVEQVLGLLPYHQLQLAVTVSRHQPGRTGPSDAAEAQDMQLPYRRLEVGAGAVCWTCMPHQGLYEAVLCATRMLHFVTA